MTLELLDVPLKPATPELQSGAGLGAARGSASANETEWTVFLYEIRHSSLRYLYNSQKIVKAATRDEALEKAKKLEQGDTHVIGVSLIPTAQYNALNCHSWKW